MATVYNYTGKDLRLFEINWDTNTIIDSYILASVDDIKIKVKNKYNINDNIEVEICEDLKLPDQKPNVIYIVDKKICKILGSLRPDFRYPEGKIVDPEDKNNYGFSLLLDYTH